MYGRSLKRLTLMQLLPIVGFVLLMPGLASAQGPGLRGGVSIDPDRLAAFNLSPGEPRASGTGAAQSHCTR